MVRTQQRPGFTLLEVMLALAIGVVMLGALYYAVDAQLKLAQTARDVVEESTIARNLLSRIANDVSTTINLANASRFRNPQGSSSSSQGSTSAGGSSTGASTTGSSSGSTGASTGSTTGSSTGSGSTSSSSTSSGSSTASTTNASTGATSTTSANGTTTTSFFIPMGLIGNSQAVHLFMSRVPKEIIGTSSSDVIPPTSDTRRVSYWLINDEEGLAQQEVYPVTSDDAVQVDLPPSVDLNAPNVRIVAEEVRTLAFSYFDGENWNDTWDSTLLGPDGVTPIGPPLAVSIDIDIGKPHSDSKEWKHYRHVVAAITANSMNAMNTSGDAATGATQTTISGGGTTP